MTRARGYFLLVACLFGPTACSTDGTGDADRDVCVRLTEKGGAASDSCMPSVEMRDAYGQPLPSPIKADDRWTSDPASIFRTRTLLIPTRLGDAQARRDGDELEVELAGQIVRFATTGPSGFAVRSERVSYDVEVVPPVAAADRERVLGHMVMELVTGTSVVDGPDGPWFGEAVLQRDVEPIMAGRGKKKSIWKKIWDRVPKQVKNVKTTVVGGVLAGIAGAYSFFYSTQEGCLETIQALCTNEALIKCPTKIPPGTVLERLEWPKVDKGNGQLENNYGTCQWHYFPAMGKFGYRPVCEEPTCIPKCKPGTDGTCSNPECQHENPGLCCEEATKVCDEVVGCQVLEVACESTETSDCGVDSACYES